MTPVLGEGYKTFDAVKLVDVLPPCEVPKSASDRMDCVQEGEKFGRKVFVTQRDAIKVFEALPRVARIFIDLDGVEVASPSFLWDLMDLWKNREGSVSIGFRGGNQDVQEATDIAIHSRIKAGREWRKGVAP